MKKTILILTSIVSLVIFSIFGCKKDLSPKEEVQIEKKEQQIDMPSQSQSQYGFLIFASLGDLNEYQEFLVTSTHGEVQQYLDSIGFHSLGETKYGEEYFTQRISEEQAIDYVLNTDEIFQLKNVIMKPINEVAEEVKWEFFLTMTSANLSTSSYESLASGTYDASTMNKFATNPEDETLDLFAFIEDTPFGYEETVANSSVARRPMFGSVQQNQTVCTAQGTSNPETGQCQKFCRDEVRTVTYVFWVGFPSDWEITSSYPVNVAQEWCN